MLIMGFKASTMDWLTTLNLPSFTFEMEYITTKNANRSVMKSAYDTIQRSWFPCSSCFFFLAMFMYHTLKNGVSKNAVGVDLCCRPLIQNRIESSVDSDPIFTW